MKKTLRVLTIAAIILNVLSGCLSLIQHQYWYGFNNFVIAMLFSYIYLFDARQDSKQ